MVTIAMVLLIASLIFFIIAAFRIALPKIDPLGMGAALALLAFLIERIKF